MLMILIISSVIMPAFMWFLLYLNITDQFPKSLDEELTMTKAEAQSDVLHRTVRSPLFWIYIIYSLCCVFAGVCSINTFSLGDWFFSL